MGQHSTQNHFYFCFRRTGISQSERQLNWSPDILIEDDCKSIGGLKECCISDVKEEMKASIQSIIVPEFSGIDSITIE